MTTQTPWYIHDLNPIAFRIGDTHVPWYWLNYLAGFLWCWYGVQFLLRTHEQRLTAQDAAAFASWGWLGMLVGSRLTYVLVYNFEWFQDHPEQLLALWNGGMSFHGGVLGIAVASWLVATFRRVPLLAFTDMIAVLIPWPILTGRLCNFLNGELPGRPSGVPWAVVFPKPWDDFPRHPSQLYEATTEGLILGLLMLGVWSRFRHLTGAASAFFLAGYGCLRFFTEFTRAPDPQLGFLAPNMTMGQILCLTMVAGGAILAMRLERKPHSH